MKVRIGLSVALFGLVAINSHADDACLKAYNAAKYEDAATECKVAAAAGDAEAMFRMASLYAVGNGVPHKPEMAVAWLKEAYRRSHEEAGYNLAVAMLQGIGTEQDMLEARLLLTRLASDGYAKAQRELGQLFLDGIAGDKDAETAESLFQAAAEQGDIQAKWLLAKFLLERDGATPQAMSWLTSAAEAGELNAQLQLGAMFEADAPEKSEHWYRKAVRQGSGMGMYKLAFLLTYGPAKQRNLKLAASLAREAERRHIDFADNLHVQIRQKLQAEVEAARQTVAVQEAAQETSVEAVQSKPLQVKTSQARPAQVAAATAAQSLAKPVTGLKKTGAGEADCGAQAYGREKDACWWQQQSAKSYTLQLGAYRSGSRVNRFIRNSGLGNGLSVTRHCAGGSNLNILTYGIYASEEQAMLARQALPTRIQRDKPWLRTVAGLQKATPCEATLATR